LIHVCRLCARHVCKQEHGDDSGGPNRKWVNVSYLDSVNYFTPDIPVGNPHLDIKLRTLVYHTVLQGYMTYAKDHGYCAVFIWASPPQEVRTTQNILTILRLLLKTITTVSILLCRVHLGLASTGGKNHTKHTDNTTSILLIILITLTTVSFFYCAVFIWASPPQEVRTFFF
jgi:hypothetical protein